MPAIIAAVFGHAYGARQFVKMALIIHLGFVTIAKKERRIQLPLAHVNLKCMPAGEKHEPGKDAES